MFALLVVVIQQVCSSLRLASLGTATWTLLGLVGVQVLMGGQGFGRANSRTPSASNLGYIIVVN